MKRILLVAGAGTLGGSTYPELVKLGHSVDVVSLEDFSSVTSKLNFIKADAGTSHMEKFLDGRRYDAIAHELTILSERPDLVARFDSPFRRELDGRMDAWFALEQK